MLTTIIVWAVVGIIAGFLAKLVVREEGPGGLLGDMFIGILGAFVGGFLGREFGIRGAEMSGINVGSVLTAFVGAILILLILKALQRRR